MPFDIGPSMGMMRRMGPQRMNTNMGPRNPNMGGPPMMNRGPMGMRGSSMMQPQRPQMNPMGMNNIVQGPSIMPPGMGPMGPPNTGFVKPQMGGEGMGMINRGGMNMSPPSMGEGGGLWETYNRLAGAMPQRRPMY